MRISPVFKPKVPTPALIVASAVALVLAVVLAILAFTSPYFGWALTVLVAFGFLLLYLWVVRIRTLRIWQAASNAQWARFEALKRAEVTTTEVTVLSVDSPQPTGAWITLRWNLFDYIQPAWIEALPEPIWPGSVLLIRPDPAQVRPGSPWPPTYHLAADHVLTWAPQI